MRQEIFTLPSGAKVKFRQLLLHDESVMADAMNDERANVEKTIAEIVANCAIGVEDPGPYSFLEVGDKPDWLQMANGDYFAASLKLRRLSYRDKGKVDVDLKCKANLTCKNSFTLEVDLEEDLIYQDLPAASIEKLKAGKPFEVEIAGRKVQYTISTGKTKKIAEKYMEQYPGRVMAAGIRARITSVEGVESRDIMQWLDGQGDNDEYMGLTSDDAEDLREAFEVVDCGVDTTLEVKCPKCGGYFEFVLPFTGIFLPSKNITKRKKEARRKKRQQKEKRTQQEVKTSEETTE